MFVLWIILIVASSVQATNYVCPHEQDSKHKDVIPVKVFAFDFDITSTLKDTTDLLYKATKKYKNGDKQIVKDLEKKWQNLNSQFLGREHRLMVKTLNTLTHSTDVATFKERELRSYLIKFNEITRDGMKVIVDRNVLKGITTDGLYTIAGQVTLYPGLLNTLQHFKNFPLNVISAGWSQTLIQTVFRKNGVSTNLIVHASKMPFKEGESTGDIATFTPSDKERILEELVSKAGDKKGYTIYVGDNTLDVLALLKADIGILINYTDMFLQLVHAFGIKTFPLTNWRTGKRLGNCSSENNVKVIYTARSWDDIGELVFGRNF